MTSFLLIILNKALIFTKEQRERIQTLNINMEFLKLSLKQTENT